MDIPKFNDFIRRLSVIKSYSSLLVPVVIGLVGVLIFMVTLLIGSKFKEEIAKESIPMGRKIRSLIRSAVSSDQWSIEEKYQQAYEEDANQIALLVKQSTQMELLSYKIFPKPKDPSTLIFDEFGRQFRDMVDALIVRVNALDCPTDAELERSLQSSRPSGSRFGRRRSSKNLSEVDATIRDVLCRAKAESASVYANPADLSGYEFWEEYEYIGMDQAAKDCWQSQLAYWVIEDVIDTIAACNSGSNSVFTSPVKRLMTANFSTSDTRSRSSVGVDDKPSYVFSIDGGLTVPCTGRISNDDIDIVHFNVVVVVSTKAVLPFMRELCSAKQHKFRGFFGKAQEQTFEHNQITILESNIGSVDREEETHSLYRYGEDAVVELSLICEYIFNKNSYDEIKPEAVKALANREP